MPEKKTMERARKAKRQGKSPNARTGAFGREEMEPVRQGKQGARSTKQGIAMGLSKTRRSGVAVPAPKKGTSARRPRKATSELAKGSTARRKPSPKRAQGAKRALKREGQGAASGRPLSRQAKSTATRRRGPASTARRGAKRGSARTSTTE